MQTDKGFKLKSGENRLGKSYKMKGVTLNILDLKISSQDTDGKLAVFEQTGHTPMGGPPLHVHLHQDEFFYILEGKYLFQVGSEKYTLTKGDTIFLPRAIPHAFIQLSNEAKVLVAYQPAGKMEDFFRKTDAWSTPPTKEEIARVFEECEMKVIGPPLQAE